MPSKFPRKSVQVQATAHSPTVPTVATTASDRSCRASSKSLATTQIRISPKIPCRTR